jgi:hypothetical protein
MEVIEMKKQIIAMLLLLSVMLLIVGCGSKVITDQDIIDCNKGSYKTTAGESMKILGEQTMQGNQKYCVTEMKFDEPKTVLGSVVKGLACNYDLKGIEFHLLRNNTRGVSMMIQNPDCEYIY